MTAFKAATSRALQKIVPTFPQAVKVGVLMVPPLAVTVMGRLEVQVTVDSRSNFKSGVLTAMVPPSKTTAPVAAPSAPSKGIWMVPPLAVVPPL